MSELKQVKASAGSGKTYQLTRRFLSLLDGSGSDQHSFSCAGRSPQGYSWPEILAATFTNKAAAEMKERVVGSLKSGALGKGDRAGIPGHSIRNDEKKLQAILRRYQRLNIRTIDSLLNMLMRLFALELGIRPDFDIALDEQELFDAAYDRFIALCESGGPEQDQLATAIITLLRAESKKGFQLVLPIRERLKAIMTFLRGLPEAEQQRIETDQQKLLDMLAAANAAMKVHVTAMQKHLETTGLPASKNFINALEKLAVLDLFDTIPESKFLCKDSLCDCINKAGKDKVDGAGEVLYAALKQGVQNYRQEGALIRGAHNLAPAVVMAKAVLGMLEKIERLKGIIPNSALPGYVNRLLDGPMVPEAFCRLGGRLHHLLIDEFQDTSRAQWQAMQPLAEECLAKGGSLFYVGDVKQAIYGWRGGDADLFDELPKIPELSAIASDIRLETLPDNWRSHRAIVEFNNTFFCNFEADEPPVELANNLFPEVSVDFTDSFAAQLRRDFSSSAQGIAPPHAETHGYVRFERIHGEKKDEIEEATLNALKKTMQEILSRRSYGDVAVLVRSGNHGALVCDLLVDMGVPVITESSLRLDRHPIIRQATALLEFLDYPRNELALAEFVMGEELFLAESGLDRDEIHAWLARPDKRPLDVRLAQDYPRQWELCIKPFYNKAGVMTPYDLMQDINAAYHVEERHPGDQLYLKRFLEVIHLAEENGHGSLSTFLDFWNENSEQEKVPLPENVDAVRIMTIHKSKGLEFPVVVVPFHHWEVQKNADYLVRNHHGTHMLAPLVKDVGKPYHANMAQAVREQLNTLYVAWTRAGEELYGIYPEEMSKIRAALEAMNLFLSPDKNGITEYGQRSGTKVQTKKDQPETGHTTIPPRKEPPELMSWLPRLRVYRHTIEECLFSERLRGEVAHRAMEHLRVTGNDETDTNRALKMAMHDFPALAGLPRETLDDLERDISTMLRWALDNAQLRTWLARGNSEPEIMDNDGKFHRVDHLYMDEDMAVVVEFKTGHKYPEHHDQVRRYLNLLANMDSVPQKRSGVLVYLDLHEVEPVADARGE
jgi:ATP-dependent exoDNAse (exonuclease V) beta subunit